MRLRALQTHQQHGSSLDCCQARHECLMTLRCGAAVVACQCAPLGGSPPRADQQPAHGARSRFPSAVARAHSRAAVAACRIMIYTKDCW